MPNRTNPSFWLGFSAGVIALGVAVMTVQMVSSKKAPVPQATVLKTASVVSSPVNTPKARRVETKVGKAPYLGPDKSKLVVQAFADFHCQFCPKQAEVLDRISATYPDTVKIKFLHFPLTAAAESAHEAAFCARDQKRFWDFHDALMVRQPVDKSVTYQIARDLSLDLKKFHECMKTGRNKKRVKSALKYAAKKKIAGTPTLRMRKKNYDGFQDYAILNAIIREHLGEMNVKKAKPSAGGFLGRPYQGSKDARITMVEYSDFHCPFCRRVQPVLDQIMKKYSGKIRRGFRHFPLDFHKQARAVHEASECAGEQGKFWEFKDAVFKEVDRTKSQAGLFAIAKELKLDNETFKHCVETRRYQSVVDDDINNGKRLGVSGTPATVFNGKVYSGALSFDKFSAIVEGVLDPSKAVPTAKAQKPEKPRQRVNFTDLAGRPMRGNPNGAITLVEFSDFHCPFCKNLSPTMKKILENYPNEVKMVWRHFPLPIHPQAELVHQASECAHAQNGFWKFKDAIFANPAANRNAEDLINLAKSLGLSKRKFKKCLNSEESKAAVASDLEAGKKAGVGGTPAVFVNGRLISGARPYDYFKKALDEEMKKT